ncbi:MAG: 2-oxoacid:acceptor oxidoreductase family protein [Deltaproteobacteria bacterium]|nr:2-oxoacid:acceptor oxidoreductase family protein [Deltaproteobacteria bacterium]
MSGRYEIRLGGSGGQGLILAGVILGEAAAIHDGKNAVQTQSYGPEARGGMSKSDVIVSNEEIDYPKAYRMDLLLALTQASFSGYVKDVKPGGLVVYDTSLVRDVCEGNYRLVGIPIVETATRAIGKSMVANVVSLGAIVELTGIVSKEAVEKSLMGRAPRGTEEINRRALHAGYDLVKNAEQKTTAGNR